MGLSTYRCPSCGKSTKTPLVTSFTNRKVCVSCRDGVTAVAAGVITGGPTSGDQIGGAIATKGWFERLRRRRRS
ncbi:hypothetical protein [Actinospongicola halichondriae]|uniref:hypothetical protein n=1 Tax=Actinospongicola halichondriae TaxID=3236844 RepID=UPI003D491182